MMVTKHPGCGWQDLLDDIVTKIKKSKGFTRYEKLVTNEERIEFCLKDEYVKLKILRWLRMVCSSRHKKYFEKAAELRVEGNACFQRKEYEKSVEYYTRSILHAPDHSSSAQSRSSGDELSLAYGNRSASLFFLQKFNACLLDIKRAIETGYPKDLCYKLYFRKAQCLVKLGPKPVALKALNETLIHLRDAKIETKKAEKYLKETELLKEYLSQSDEISFIGEENFEDPVPQLSYGCQSTLAFASAALEMRMSLDKGRFIVCNRPLKAGDTLFVERPYASVLLPNHYNLHCHHCYQALEASVPCPNCSQVRFCSEVCCREAWKRFHKWECGNLDMLHSIGIAHLGLRLIITTGLQNLTDFYGRSLEPSPQTPAPNDNSYYNVFHLVGHSDKMHVEDTFQYALTATLLLLFLERIGFLSTDKDQGEDRIKDDILNSLRQMEMSPLHRRSSSRNSPSHGQGNQVTSAGMSMPMLRPESLRLYLGGLVLRHLFQLVCNAHAITALQKSSPISGSAIGGVVNERQVRIATAIYPTSSLMNHCCDPSIISSFHKDILIVRAIKEVSTNGELYNCYGPHYKRMSKEDRQKALREQYFFQCECEACMGEEDREQRFQGLKCTHCNGPLKLPDTSNRSVCLDCNVEQECVTQLQKVFAAHDLFVQGLQLAAKGNFRDALDKLRRCLKIRERAMYHLHRQLAEVQDQIARCYASLGEYCLAVEYLRPTLSSTEAAYGENSIELANELQKFTDLILNALLQLAKEGSSLKTSIEVRDYLEEAKTIVNRAEKIFVLHYGAHHESVKELRSKKDELDQLCEPKQV